MGLIGWLGTRLELATTGKALRIGFDPHLFDEQRSGAVTLTVHIPGPDQALEWIRAEQRAAEDRS
jgi:hypothetical protein